MEVDGLIQVLRRSFESLMDHRAANCSYRLSDNLMTAFAMFHQKDPSLLAFREQFPARSQNMRQIYGLDQIAEDTGLRKCLDGVQPALLQGSFKSLLQEAEQSRVLAAKHVLGNYLAISFDGTGYFGSSNLRCSHCLVHGQRGGHTTYHHKLLGAVIVHPTQETVLPVYAEPIVNGDGAKKNDCERVACKRLIPNVRALLPGQAIVAVLDALYAVGPTIEALQQAEMDYIITIKEGYVLEQVEQARQGDTLSCVRLQNGPYDRTLRYAQELVLSGTYRHCQVNYLECEEVDRRTGVVTYKNAWITSLELTPERLHEISQVARSRWKIENETFNTLKNQGYHLEHNFGHGKQFLSSVFALVMLLAFMVDQLAQAADPAFQKAMRQYKTRQAFWKRVASIFDVIPSLSMNAIYRFIAGEIQLNLPQLE